MARRYGLTPFERVLTSAALEQPDSEREQRARIEAQRISMLAGCWEAMAVRDAMRAAAQQRKAAK